MASVIVNLCCISSSRAKLKVKGVNHPLPPPPPSLRNDFTIILKNIRSNSEYTFLLKETKLFTNLTLKSINKVGFNTITEFGSLNIKPFCPTLGQNAFEDRAKCLWLFLVSFADLINYFRKYWFICPKRIIWLDQIFHLIFMINSSRRAFCTTLDLHFSPCNAIHPPSVAQTQRAFGVKMTSYDVVFGAKMTSY